MATMWSLLSKWQRATKETERATQAHAAASREERAAREAVAVAMRRHFPVRKVEHDGFLYWIDRTGNLCVEEAPEEPIASIAAGFDEDADPLPDEPQTPLAATLQAAVEHEERKAAFEELVKGGA